MTLSVGKEPLIDLHEDPGHMCDDCGQPDEFCKCGSNSTPVLSKPGEENILDRDILQKALDKAVKNGYLDWGMPRGFAVYSVIFSHGFAKAFWGECKRWIYCIDGEGMDYVNEIPEEIENWEEYKEVDGWSYHLQRMVLEENPIKYLEKFL